MKKSVVIIGAILILISIAVGAMGAHALKEILSVKSLNSIETAVRYQMYMGIAILSLGMNYHKFRKRSFNYFYLFILIGSILFSFSIYGLIWADYSSLFSLKKVIGPITPLGGTLMIIGWSIFIVQLLQKKDEDSQ